MHRNRPWFLVLCLLLVGSLPAVAQGDGSEGGIRVPATQLASADPIPAWGIADTLALVIPVSALRPGSSTVTWVNAGTPGLHETSVSGDWWTGFQLPSGANLLGVVIQACDTSATGYIQFGLWASGNISDIGTTGAAPADTPGCSFYSVAVAAPHTVNNLASPYKFFLNFGDTSSANSIQNVLIAYRLQVSPAPATATFTDVPVGNPLHQYVEALVDAGITAGCGGGNYCPGDAVTRGQMAVFIAKALGLHWIP